jgi:hypothetical protein
MERETVLEIKLKISFELVSTFVDAVGKNDAREENRWCLHGA